MIILLHTPLRSVVSLCTSTNFWKRTCQNLPHFHSYSSVYFGRIQAVISIIIIPTMLKNRKENHFHLFRSCPEFPEFFWNLWNWLEVRLGRRMSYEHTIITLWSVFQHIRSLLGVIFGK